MLLAIQIVLSINLSLFILKGARIRHWVTRVSIFVAQNMHIYLISHLHLLKLLFDYFLLVDIISIIYKFQN